MKLRVLQQQPEEEDDTKTRRISSFSVGSEFQSRLNVVLQIWEVTERQTEILKYQSFKSAFSVFRFKTYLINFDDTNKLPNWNIQLTVTSATIWHFYETRHVHFKFTYFHLEVESKRFNICKRDTNESFHLCSVGLVLLGFTRFCFSNNWTNGLKMRHPPLRWLSRCPQ